MLGIGLRAIELAEMVSEELLACRLLGAFVYSSRTRLDYPTHTSRYRSLSIPNTQQRIVMRDRL